MIISKTPYRISFFGGGTDYKEWYSNYGSEIISTSINKYIYLSLRKLPPFFKKKNRVIYSSIEEIDNFNQIKLFPLKRILLYEKINNGIEFHYDGQMPAKSGVGSSSSFVVGLINLCSCIKNKNLSKYELAKKAISIEKNLLKETVGIQDQIASSFGGLNYIKIDKKGHFKVKKIFKDTKDEKKLNDNLVLLYTGIQKLKREDLKKYVKNLKIKSYDYMKHISEITKEAKKLLINKNFEEFGKLLDISWHIKKKLSNKISNSSVDEIYNFAKKNGAVGGKILGAGGGGFFLFYVPKEKRKSFLNKMNFLVNVDFRFDNDGSKILLADKNEKF